jgi:hypothetical protein
VQSIDKNSKIKKDEVLGISASIRALILCLLIPSIASGSLPLTETINTIPEGEVELIFRAEYLKKDISDYRRESYGLGLGILPQLSMWYSLHYIHQEAIKSQKNELGDTFLRIWYYIDDYFNDTLHLGFLTIFRLPTGKNAYEEEEWQNISFGNNELKVGPVFQLDLARVFFHINTLYVFREGEGEKFYDGIYINPLKKETYQKVFGLNFKSGDTFLEEERLKNDYIIISLAVNTDILYPVIPYFGFYYSSRLSRDANTQNIPIEGAGVNPVLVSLGLRYFFSESLYAGFYSIISLIRESNYVNEIYGFDFSLQF